MHGVSNRLTGGPQNVRCLNTYESAGMGEGWSDAIGVFLSRTAESTRYDDVTVGKYVINMDRGIRNFPYSTRTKTNPLKLEDLLQMNEVHNIGEVWANMLNEMYWNLGNLQLTQLINTDSTRTGTTRKELRAMSSP
jgi:extracellular elastinolytic metalloproteinase